MGADVAMVAGGAARREPPSPVGWVWWTLTGALAGLGVASLLTVGLVLLAAAAVLAVVGLAVARLRTRAALMAVAGLAAAPLTIAWLNRRGPGVVCTVSGGDQTCVEEYAPWPFLVVALLLVAAAVVAVLGSRRTER